MTSRGSESEFRATAAWPTLQRRAALLRQLRQFFERRDFTEVETPLLSRDCVVDLHLDPIPVSLFDDAHSHYAGRRMWLQTSPEFAMKRLLASGAERIFQIAKAFRGGERGDWHNPEFTIVEWYRVGDGLHEGMELLAELARELLQVPQVDSWSYREAFERVLEIDPHRATIEVLERLARSRSDEPPSTLHTRDEWLNYLLASHVEPLLGIEKPVILFDYPASQAALARTRRTDGGIEVAERFELYYRGVELANGYHELLDHQILESRQREANRQRVAGGRYPVPEHARLLDAMREGLPACSGTALGFDRLAMLVCGAQQIRDVIAFPIDRA